MKIYQCGKGRVSGVSELALPQHPIVLHGVLPSLLVLEVPWLVWTRVRVKGEGPQMDFPAGWGPHAASE